MIKNLLILAILGILIGTSVFSSGFYSVSGELIQEKTNVLSDLDITKTTSNNEEKGFIFGKVTKLTYFWGLIALEVVKIHVITLNPFNFNTYLANTRVTVLNGYKGFLGNNSVILWGKFSVIPPESDILHLVVNERDPVNYTVQWIVTDAPLIQQSGISWAVLDVNNTNVTGTNVTRYHWDALCNTEGDTYDVQVEQHGVYTFCLTFEATGLLLFKSEPELY
jgi:hypothetical protein